VSPDEIAVNVVNQERFDVINALLRRVHRRICILIVRFWRSTKLVEMRFGVRVVDLRLLVAADAFRGAGSASPWPFLSTVPPASLALVGGIADSSARKKPPGGNPAA
jgi:hypothetical protein